MFQRLLPHLLIVAAFVVLSLAYVLPVLKGNMLAQHDVIQSQGMYAEIKEYHEEEGELMLWTNSQFCGMPSYQIWMDYPSNLISYYNKMMKALFPGPSRFIFPLLLGLYILLYSYTRNYWIGFVGAIAFTFSSINFINIDAGHTNKVMCVSLIAPVLAGILAAFRGKPMVGAAIMGFFLAIQIRSNHFQITYYTGIAGAAITLFFVIRVIKEGTFRPYLKASAFLIIALLLAVGANLAQLWTTYEYSQETIRGGRSKLSSDREFSGGLDKGYAQSWSYGKFETFTLLIPNFMGGATTEELGEASNFYKELSKRTSAQQSRQLIKRAPTYWGDQPFTAGPTYFGAVVCFLFVLGMFLIRDPIKWLFLFLVVLSIFLSWGKNFELFNDLFFYYFPLYNKFRTPSMVLTLTNVVMVFVAGVGMLEILKGERSRKELIDGLKRALGIVGGVIILLGILGSFFYDFSGPADVRYEEGGWPIDALRADRASMMRMDAFRSLTMILFAAGLLWAFVGAKLKGTYFVTLVTALVLFDGWAVCKRYLNDDDFVSKTERKRNFQPTEANLKILQDKELYYRVLDLTSDPFRNATPSNFHKSVGGYHAAKLRNYQDLIENQITKNIASLNAGLKKGKIPVLNMLNTKYIITSTKDVARNPYRLGNAWFVEEYRIVKSADQEMAGLADFDPGRTAIVRDDFAEYLSDMSLLPNPEDNIELSDYRPNHLTYQSSAGSEQLAVFSEIYYDQDKGWNAYVDEEPVDHIRVNYTLRALRLPAGEHKVEFKFEPKSYFIGEKVSLACSSIVLLALSLLVVFEVRRML